MQIFVHADIGLGEDDTASSEASAAYGGVLRLMLRELGAEAAYVGIDEAEPAAGYVSLTLKNNGEHLGWMGWRGGLETREASLPYREIAADLARNQRLARRALEAEREVNRNATPTLKIPSRCAW